MHASRQRLLNHTLLTQLPQVSSKIAQRYAQLNIITVKDLLLHLPFRYEDRTLISKISELEPNQTTSVLGQIVNVYLSNHKKPRLICIIKDDFHVLTLQFIHFNAYLKNQLQIGAYLKAYGETKMSSNGLEMIHPQISVAQEKESLLNQQSKSYTPVYPTTAGLSQLMIRKHMNSAIKMMLEQTVKTELLPIEIAKYLPSLEDAIIFLHYPPLGTDLNRIKNGQHKTIRRLIIEELLAYQYAMHQIKTETDVRSIPLFSKNDFRDRFLKMLPFMPTKAQQRVIQEIEVDLEKNKAMLRLVQGDVGSGKTLVAAFAALRALENRKQVALMAPTEILAEQHFITFQKWFEPLSIRVALLTGKKTAKQKKLIYEKLKNGEIDLIIGTHALFVDKVEFMNLSLVIIDEQHRFGVNQRLSLWNKGQDKSLPHQLIMTATPIPRTLAMSIYADLNLSIIDELPAGRKPIKTSLVSTDKRLNVIKRVAQAVHEGRQVYWVCTLVEESEMIDAKAAEDHYAELCLCFPQIKIGLIHGKMKPAEKEQVMRDFKDKKLDILIATTVIEVGVDVPNASVMIIENAERLGLSQLHQLRGRVGRGNIDSFCLLMYQSPLSKTAKERLQIMQKTNDGFIIAEKDFEIRGAGEILGTKQIGLAEFKTADLIRDQALFSKLAPFSKTKSDTNLKALMQFWLEEKEKYIHA